MTYYNKNKNSITCLLCSHYCKLKEGQIGICGVNKNEGGSLKNLVYGHPVTINIDPVEKKPLYHFLPLTKTLSFGTVGCNFKCPFCQNWSISQEKNINTSTFVEPKQMVQLALSHGCKSISYTYNEPTIFYPYAKDIGVIARENGLKNIFVSNGFESKEVVKDMKYWLDGANIDLKSWDDGYYKKILKGGLEQVKSTIKNLVKEGIWIEVTTLLIEGDNDKEEDLKEMAKFLVNEVGDFVPWHLSAFHGNYKMREHKNTSLDRLLFAKDIALKEGLKYVYLGNVAYPADTYCPNCGELLIDRSGFNVIINKLENGRCPKCQREIEGVWR